MVGKKVRSFAPRPQDVLEDMVPKDHFYRRLEARLDFSFVRDLVAPPYAGAGRAGPFNVSPRPPPGSPRAIPPFRSRSDCIARPARSGPP